MHLHLFSCLLFALLLQPGKATATWSIIVVDPITHDIGIAGASCTQSVYGIGAIIPGKGAIVVQAMSNYFARVKGFEMIVAEASPTAILEALQAPNFSPELQQYAFIQVKYIDSPKTYTGELTNPIKGALTAKGVSVQGNTLAHPELIKEVLQAITKAQQQGLPMAEVMMRGLEAGATLGGDKRCGEITALSAFISIAKPDDNRKQPYLNLVVYGTAEKNNAIAALRKKLEEWKSGQQR